MRLGKGWNPIYLYNPKSFRRPTTFRSTRKQSTGAMTEPALRTKQQVWKQAHAERVECPDCHRFVTLRTLRWRHSCGRRSLAQRLLDAKAAELRRQGLTVLALSAHEERKRRRSEAEAEPSSCGTS